MLLFLRFCYIYMYIFFIFLTLLLSLYIELGSYESSVSEILRFIRNKVRLFTVMFSRCKMYLAEINTLQIWK